MLNHIPISAFDCDEDSTLWRALILVRGGHSGHRTPRGGDRILEGVETVVYASWEHRAHNAFGEKG